MTACKYLLDLIIPYRATRGNLEGLLKDRPDGLNEELARHIFVQLVVGLQVRPLATDYGNHMTHIGNTYSTYILMKKERKERLYTAVRTNNGVFSRRINSLTVVLLDLKASWQLLFRFSCKADVSVANEYPLMRQITMA